MCVYLFTKNRKPQSSLFSVERHREMGKLAQRSYLLLSVKAVVLLFLYSSYLRDLQSLSSPTFSQQITIYYVIQRVERAYPPMTRQVTVFDTGIVAFPKKYSVWITSYPYKIIFNLKE